MSQAEQNQKAILATSQVRSLLERSKSEVAAALPKHLTADRMLRLAMTEFRQNPDLLDCEPKSFLGAVIQASQLGLEIGRALGQVWLVPFKNVRAGTKEVQFILGYRGMITLALRSGAVSKVEAHAVREGDHFEYAYGMNERLSHRLSESADREEKPITHVYSFARMKDGTFQFEVMTLAQVEKVRSQSKMGERGPWKDHFEEMARKTAVRRLFKYLPVSIEISRALEFDAAASNGVSQNNAAVFDVEKSDYSVKEESPITPKEKNQMMADAVAKAEGKEPTAWNPPT